MRLLLADDEHELADALAAILKRSNYSVDVVYDGVDALDYIRTGLYDGCILDIMMPGTDGITVLKTARKEGFTLPVLLLTAKSGTDDKVEGLDSGANDYLTKPFAAKELLARIRASALQTKNTRCLKCFLSIRGMSFRQNVSWKKSGATTPKPSLT